MRLGLFVFSGILLVSSMPAHSDSGCGLQAAQRARQAEVRQRNAQVVHEGINERNHEVVAQLPQVGQGSCMDQIYGVMDGVVASMQSPLGSLLTRQLTGALGSMACQEAQKRYQQILNTQVGKYSDPFGIISNPTGTPNYSEGRTTTVDVRRAAEIGRQAGSAAKGVPIAPPGREPVTGSTSAYGSTPGFGEGARNAIQGL